MTKKKKLWIAVCVLLTVALIVGITVVAANNYGTQSDPLVTLSYANNLKTDILNSANSQIGTAKTQLSAELASQISTFTANIESKLTGSALPSTADAFSVVTLSQNQVITCQPGTEIMLRIGSAVSYGSDSPRLVDTTTATEVSSAGSSLTTNHMYMVTIAGNGIKASASTVKVLIRGDYTVS